MLQSPMQISSTFWDIKHILETRHDIIQHRTQEEFEMLATKSFPLEKIFNCIRKSKEFQALTSFLSGVEKSTRLRCLSFN